MGTQTPSLTRISAVTSAPRVPAESGECGEKDARECESTGLEAFGVHRRFGHIEEVYGTSTKP